MSTAALAVNAGRDRRWVSKALKRGPGKYLANHIAAAVDSRIASGTLAANGDIFSTWTAADIGPFTRNVDFWGADLVSKLTCICPSREGSALFGLGILITPRHILYHKHGGAITNGDTMRFVAADNTIVLRTQDQSTPTTIPDFRVGLLNEDLPGTVLPCPIAPDNFASCLGLYPPVPVMIVDQEGKGLVRDISQIDGRFVHCIAPVDPQRLEFYEVGALNDSGKGWFVPINGEMVLLGVTQSNTYAQGVMGWNSVINAAIVTVDALGAVSTGYTVSNPTLAGF